MQGQEFFALARAVARSPRNRSECSYLSVVDRLSTVAAECLTADEGSQVRHLLDGIRREFGADLEIEMGLAEFARSAIERYTAVTGGAPSFTDWGRPAHGRSAAVRGSDAPDLQ